MSLRALGVLPWLGGTLVVGVAALWFARTRYGWLLATVLQLVALPRVLLVNLALLLAAPLPRSRRPPSRPIRLSPDRRSRSEPGETVTIMSLVIYPVHRQGRRHRAPASAKRHRPAPSARPG